MTLARSLPAVFVAAAALGACNSNTAPGNDRAADSAPPPEPAQLADVRSAVSEADLKAVEPSTMTLEEIARAVGPDPACRFTFTKVGMPVLAAGEAEGGPAAVVKLNGKLVRLAPAAGEGTFSAGPVTVTVTPDGERTAPGRMQRRQANLVFTLDGGRTVGYRGFYACGAEPA